MKRKLLYLLPLFLVFESGCLSDKNNAPSPNNAPEGVFSGKFKFTHLHSKTGTVDSATAIIQLKMEAATGFQVTGDTATVHAGSFGSYIVSTPYNNVDFVDHTYPTTGTPPKNHLNGVYTYSYDGTTLQLVAYGAFDTLSYYYNLKKIGN